MRLSEKTLEVNFCVQQSWVIPAAHWWFGLTQKQEKEAGWDVASKIAGQWTRFQLKASSHVLASGARRFKAQHHQMVALQGSAGASGKTFYVLPTIGTTAELTAVGFNLLDNIRLLDVHDIPIGIPAPTKADGTPRKSCSHYVDLDAGGNWATIHSDPVVVGVTSANQMGEAFVGFNDDEDSEPSIRAEEVRGFLEGGRNRVALFVPAPNTAQ